MNNASADQDPLVEIRRSTRRRRTVQARVEGDRIVVLVPARMSRAEEAKVVSELVGKLRSRVSGGDPRHSDARLAARAELLRRRYLPTAPEPSSVRWVTNQNGRWGSCTPSTGRIRLSHRLQGMPGYVIDCVLLHELAHLVHADHSPEFWSLVSRFERADLAKAYLAGAAFAAGWPAGDGWGAPGDGAGADPLDRPRQAALFDADEDGEIA